MLQNQNFKILAVCEDGNAEEKAQALSDRLKTELRHECTIQSEFLTFDSLTDSGARSRFGGSDDANLIVISASGQSDLPAAIEQWLEQSLGNKSAPTALVALVDGNASDVDAGLPEFCSKLRRIAQDCGLDFFCNRPGWEDRYAEYTNRITRWRHERSRIDVEPIYHNEFSWRGWGIND